MVQNRPAIPEPMKRQVRQRCGFGCVVCGAPIFDYDHMIPYETVLRHTEENLTLLCKHCHGEKTAGRMSIEYVQEKNRRPFNRRAGFTSPRRVGGQLQGRFLLSVGTNLFEYTQIEGQTYWTILVNYEPVIGVTVEDGEILLNLQLRGADGEIVLSVDRGEVKVSVGVWDYQVEGHVLTIRSGPRQITVRLEFRDGLIWLRKALFCSSNGTTVSVDEADVFLNGGGGLLAGNRVQNIAWLFTSPPPGTRWLTVDQSGFIIDVQYMQHLREAIGRGELEGAARVAANFELGMQLTAIGLRHNNVPEMREACERLGAFLAGAVPEFEHLVWQTKCNLGLLHYKIAVADRDPVEARAAVDVMQSVVADLRGPPTVSHAKQFAQLGRSAIELAHHQPFDQLSQLAYRSCTRGLDIYRALNTGRDQSIVRAINALEEMCATLIRQGYGPN